MFFSPMVYLQIFKLFNIYLYSIMKYTISLKSKIIPQFWRQINYNNSHNRYLDLRDSLLVFDSCEIERRIININGYTYIYVPPMLEKKAIFELNSYHNERQIYNVGYNFHIIRNSFFSCILFVLIALWHCIISGWWNFHIQSANYFDWFSIGSLDNINVKLYHQWYRLATSLSLHADSGHLFGNILFGCFFIIILSRRIGYGIALLLSILGGILGNFCSIYLHKMSVASIGYSTALFATIGILCGFQAGNQFNSKSIFLYLATAFALLAILGAGNERTDYAAHICGLIMGMLLGIAIVPLIKIFRLQALQFFSALAGIMILIFAWVLATLYN